MLAQKSAKLFIYLACTLLFGCVSTSNVLEIGKDTYQVSSTADGFRTAAAAKESAFETGAQKCASLGKKFLFVNSSTAPTRMGIDTTVTVNFRCLAENDPEYVRPNIRNTPSLVIENK